MNHITSPLFLYALRKRHVFLSIAPSLTFAGPIFTNNSTEKFSCKFDDKKLCGSLPMQGFCGLFDASVLFYPNQHVVWLASVILV